MVHARTLLQPVLFTALSCLLACNSASDVGTVPNGLPNGATVGKFRGSATGTVGTAFSSTRQTPGSVLASIQLTQTQSGYVLTGIYTRDGHVFTCDWDAKKISDEQFSVVTPASCSVNLSQTAVSYCDSGTIVVDSGTLTLGLASGTSTLRMKGNFGICSGGGDFDLTFSGRRED
jgi:hypothetical protein